MWLDGICNKCGALVIECSAVAEGEDYKNMCMNRKCEEHRWHYVADLEEGDYYYHYPGLQENELLIKFLKELSIKLAKQEGEEWQRRN